MIKKEVAEYNRLLLELRNLLQTVFNFVNQMYETLQTTNTSFTGMDVDAQIMHMINNQLPLSDTLLQRKENLRDTIQVHKAAFEKLLNDIQSALN